MTTDIEAIRVKYKSKSATIRIATLDAFSVYGDINALLTHTGIVVCVKEIGK